MTGDGDDSDGGRPGEVAVAETLDEMLAAGDLSLAAAPGGYGAHEVFAPEVIDAALGDLAEAGLLTMDEAVFDDAGDGDGNEDVDDPDDLDDSDQDDLEDEEEDEVYLDESAFGTVTVASDTARIIVARHVTAGTIAELGDRACGLLEEAARSGVGIDSELLTDGMTACWDRLRPYLGPADGELVKDLLAMRSRGLASLVYYPGATEAGAIGFAEKLVADYEQALGPGHPDAWEAQRNMAHAYGRFQHYDEAIVAFTRRLRDMERALPADNVGILGARQDLALAHMNAGRYQDAVSQYTQLLADSERVSGTRDDGTLMVRGALGEAYLEVGRIAEGIKLMEAAAAGLPLSPVNYPEAARLREAIDEARGDQRSRRKRSGGLRLR
ncbi:MAG: tetratricopeptide repeat protein [Trebonia sp.]